MEELEQEFSEDEISKFPEEYLLKFKKDVRAKYLNYTKISIVPNLIFKPKINSEKFIYLGYGSLDLYMVSDPGLWDRARTKTFLHTETGHITISLKDYQKCNKYGGVDSLYFLSCLKIDTYSKKLRGVQQFGSIRSSKIPKIIDQSDFDNFSYSGVKIIKMVLLDK